jgi:hypothetical protein
VIWVRRPSASVVGQRSGIRRWGQPQLVRHGSLGNMAQLRERQNQIQPAGVSEIDLIAQCQEFRVLVWPEGARVPLLLQRLIARPRIGRQSLIDLLEQPGLFPRKVWRPARFPTRAPGGASGRGRWVEDRRRWAFRRSASSSSGVISRVIAMGAPPSLDDSPGKPRRLSVRQREW